MSAGRAGWLPPLLSLVVPGMDLLPQRDAVGWSGCGETGDAPAPAQRSELSPPSIRGRQCRAVRPVVGLLSAEFARPGRDDGRARSGARRIDNLARGAAFRARVREALGGASTTHGQPLERRLDIPADPWHMVLPVPGGRQARPDDRLPAAPGPRHRCWTGLLPQGHGNQQRPRSPRSDTRWECHEPTSTVVAAPRGSRLAPWAGANQPNLNNIGSSDRAG